MGLVKRRPLTLKTLTLKTLNVTLNVTFDVTFGVTFN